MNDIGYPSSLPDFVFLPSPGYGRATIDDHSQLTSGPQHDGALQGLKRGFSGFYYPDPALLGEQAQSQPLLPPATRLWKYWSKITSFGEGFSRPEFCARRPGGGMEHYARRVGTVTVQSTFEHTAYEYGSGANFQMLGKSRSQRR